MINHIGSSAEPGIGGREPGGQTRPQRTPIDQPVPNNITEYAPNTAIIGDSQL